MNIALLKKHFEQTPRMEIQDAVKLAYQSAFGCGHLLPAQDVCARMIANEINDTAEDEDVFPFMPITTLSFCTVFPQILFLYKKKENFIWSKKLHNSLI